MEPMGPPLMMSQEEYNEVLARVIVLYMRREGKEEVILSKEQLNFGPVGLTLELSKYGQVRLRDLPSDIAGAFSEAQLTGGKH